MKFQIVLVVFLFLISFDKNVNSQRTFLDFIGSPILQKARRTFNALIEPRSFERGLVLNKRDNKVQRQFTEESPFFCDVNGPGARSNTIPKSVHELRPGDIDVVGAIGDSLTAGNGAFALDVFQVLLEGRGVSWSIGGQGNWRSFLTLPNILKEFNPNLYGYATNGHGNADQKSSRFNVASAGAMISDTVHQAKNLVKRIRNDPKVNIKHDWKLITYMIGGNDFCLDICYHQNQDKVVEKAGNALLLALRIIKDNLPRTMVNVVLPPDVTILTRFTNQPRECQSLHYIECPCFFSFNHLKNRERSINTIKRWQRRMVEITKMAEFHNSIDFEVNLHTFLVKTDIPKDSQGITDYTYLSKDCFHLSQLGHARAANAYWNSLLTPGNKREMEWKKEFDEVKCPTSLHPFLMTRKNS